MGGWEWSSSGAGEGVGPEGSRDLEKQEKGRWPDGSLAGATRISGERDQKEEEMWVRVFRVWGF